MKKHSLYFLLFISIYSFSQNNNKSLLWQISGNNLPKNSYLYGTMHVSKKVAFRLDDVFFKALEKSELIALESDPTTWLDSTYETSMLSNNTSSYKYNSNFYESLFEFSPPKELDIRNSIRFDNRIINGYLYRKTGSLDNFEEETYIDMFIFQAGKKHRKPIIGLENLEESRHLTTKARAKIRKKKIDPWLQKLMAEKNMFTFYESVYRDRNIELLDSIGSATNTEYYRENMLYKRNANMVKVLDSIMQNKSVFAGVGAAHLAGDKGMLNMLKQKGYTVKPLVSNQTIFAKSEKENLDKLYVKPELKTQKTPDHFISIKSFDELREFNYKGLKYYVALDMTNGAYLTIVRHHTYDFLPIDKPITLDYIYNLLYEDIPGDIIKKEKINTPFPGIRILNKTKKGDYQKYEIYKTPFEICIFKFAGKSDFVLKHEKEIFESLKFNSFDNSLQDYKEPFNKYSVTFPKYKISNNLNYSGNKSLQGYNGKEYYFISESPRQDISYIEDDTFEAKHIHTSFYDKLDLKEIYGNYTNETHKSYESNTIVDSTETSKLHLKSVVKDGSYYLLGYSGKDSSKAKAYFSSFKFLNTTYNNFEKRIDTSLHFTVNTTTKPPLPYQYYSFRKVNPYDETSKSTSYTSKANEKIFVNRKKYHNLQMFENIDSLWNSMKPKKKQPINNELNFIALNNKMLEYRNEKKYKKGNNYIYEYALKDSASSKAIIVKKILKKGVLFDLKTLVDTISRPSKFITEFYDSFTPKDTLLGESVFKDKTSKFFTALKNNDSIILNGFNKVKFNDENSKQLIDVIKYFEFPENRTKVKTHLVYELGQLNNPLILPFLKQLYRDSYTSPKIQIAILKSLMDSKDSNSYKTVLKLIETDLPLNKSIPSLFKTKKDSLELKKALFPELLNYISVPEYKNPIYKLLTQLVDSNIINPKRYKKFISQINNDAVTEIKRSLGNTNSSYFNKKKIKLDDYVKILFPYRKEKKVSDFFKKLLTTKDYQALTSYHTLLAEHSLTIPKDLKLITEKNIKAQGLLIHKLSKKSLLNVNTVEAITQKQYAKSILFYNKKIKETDSIIFINDREIKTDTDKDVIVYFFKLKSESIYRESSRLHYVAFLKPEKNILEAGIYYRSRAGGIFLNESKSEEEFLNDALKLVKHKTRKRVKKRYLFF